MVNEKTAVSKLKETLTEKFNLLDFCVFGSKARGDSSPDSDIDVMIEIEDYNPAIESAIDDLVYKINLTYDCFISTIIFSKKELEEGPMRESPIYKVIEKEGIRI
ncbi:MAG: nucleotidyltransferase domain-containing protein [Nitrospirae bacterium]|nr:nucleotidyltransferase domain-containing protein [Nitrospirota bacterium]